MPRKRSVVPKTGTGIVENPRSARLDTFPSEDVVRLFLAEEAQAIKTIQAVARPLTELATIVAQRLEKSARLVYVGEGTVGRMASFEAAECGLYRNATWVLSPLQRTAPEALNLATELANAVGARPVVLEAKRHDRLVASISHLPFLVASALTAAVAQVGAGDPAVWDLAAGGFRDTSRVAASETQMFLDILMTNRSAVLEQVESFERHLGHLRDLLTQADEPALRRTLSESRTARAEWKKR